jgi:hypothetical protein
MLLGIRIKGMLHACDFAILCVFLGWALWDIWEILRG